METNAQPMSFRLILLALLIALILPALCKTVRHQHTVKLSSLYAYEGDDIAFRCTEKLIFPKVDQLHPGVGWYLNDGVIDRNSYRRLRFSIRRNSIHIATIRREDAGIWAIRPRSPEYSQHGVADSRSKSTVIWCNFTLVVLENPENPSSLPIDSQTQPSAWEKKSLEQPQEIKNHRLFEINRTDLSSQYRGFDERRKSQQLIVKRAGESLALKCPSYDYRLSQPPLIEWRKNGKIIRHSKNWNKWLLKIHAITKKDSGEYMCVTSNILRSKNFTFHLTVLRKDASLKPKLLGMQNVTVRVGDTARLNCSMASQDHGFSTVEWLLQASVNGSKVDSMGAPFFEILDVDYSDGKDRRILSIENITHEDDGKYFCVVKNKHGTSVQSSWLIVGDVEDVIFNRFTSQTSMVGAVCGAILILSVCIVIVLVRAKCREMKRSSYSYSRSLILNKRETMSFSPRSNNGTLRLITDSPYASKTVAVQNPIVTKMIEYNKVLNRRISSK